MVKKAVANIMILMGMALGLFLIFFDLSPSWTQGDIYKVTLNTHVYGMNNALDGAELYADTSLDYSVYQALYTTLGNGGFPLSTSSRGQPGLILWRDPDSGLSPPDDDQVGEAIRAATETNLKKYTSEPYSFGDYYNVIFPDYSVSLGTSLGELSASASSGDKTASVTKMTEEYGMKEDITMNRRILPQGTYGVDYSSMLALGRGIDTDSVSGEIRSIINQSLQSTLNTEEVRNEIKESINSTLASMSESAGDYSLRMEIQDLSVSGYWESDESYSFNVAATVKSTITYEDKDFPVYSSSQGKIVMDKMRLVFLDRYPLSFHS